MNIQINALDTLFFKDGKPFSMGEETWAASSFPPNPSVFAGFIKTIYIVQNQILINEAKQKTQQLQINLINLVDDDIIYFPIPADIICYKHNLKDLKVEKLELTKNETISNYNLPYILKSSANIKTEDLQGDGQISLAQIKKYLNGELFDTSIFKIKDFLKSEPKIGIGRNNETRTSENGMLYRVGMQRINKLKFQINFSGLDIESNGFNKLGAEGKIVNYYHKPAFVAPKVQINSNKFKIYLSTPAIFENGFKPKTFLTDFDFEIKLIACAIGKPNSIGGFDMLEKQPKNMYKAVPAGSVYYYETETIEQAQVVSDKINSKSISEHLANEGYGICFTGNI